MTPRDALRAAWRPLRLPGLARRMLLWTVGVTALIVAALLAWNHHLVTQRMEREARDRVRIVAEGVAGRIDAELGSVQGLATGLAQVLQARRLALGEEEVRELLDRVLRDHPGLQGVAIALAPGLRPPGWSATAPQRVRRGDGLVLEDLAAPGRSDLDGDWFHLPRHLGRAVWSEPHVRSDGVVSVTYSVPMHLPSAEGPRFAGVVSCDVDLRWLDRLIAQQPLGEGGYGLIMTRSGTYVSHPIESIRFAESVFSLAEARGDAALRALGRRMVSGEPGLVAWRSWTTDERSWLAWQPLRTAEWTAATVVSQAALQAELMRQLRDEALIGGVGLVVLLLAVAGIARSVTRPVHALSQAVATLSSGDLDAPLPAPRGRDEVARLTGAFATMRDRLRQHIADLQASTAARERMSSELRVAHDIQMDLVPKTFPAFPHRDDVDLGALIVPAREVGGDFYDFFFLDGQRLVITIGDVSGKGVPAALFMAVTRSFLRSEFKADADPGRVLSRVNDELAEGNDSCMFVTLFCAVVDLASGQVRHGNAGHNPPIWLQASGDRHWLAPPPGSLAAGILPGTVFATVTLQLQPHDALLLYTDGVTEAMDPDGRLFGNDRLTEAVQPWSTPGCRELLDRVHGAVQRHAAGAEQSDDITMLMFRWTPPGHPPVEAGWDWEDRFAATPDALAQALQRLDAVLDTRPLPAATAHAIRFVFEELATNAVKYGDDGGVEGQGLPSTAGPGGHEVDVEGADVVERADENVVEDAGADAAGAAAGVASGDRCRDSHRAGHEAHGRRIGVRLRLGPPAELWLEDDGRPFDPTQAPAEPDLDMPVADRPVGGLGLYLVRQMSQGMHYERADGLNRVQVRLLAGADGDAATVTEAHDDRRLHRHGPQGDSGEPAAGSG